MSETNEELTPRQIWVRDIENYMARLRAVKIPPDLNPAMLKHVSSQLAELYEEIRPVYGKVKVRIGEVERLLYRVETKGRVGSSEASRRINGITSLESFRQSDGTHVDLFGIELEAKTQKEEIEVLIDIIESKRTSLIPFSLCFKIEAGLM